MNLGRFLASIAVASALTSPVAHADQEPWTAAFAPLPERAEAPGRPITPERVTLGRRLFNDTRMSKTGKISCNTCHNLETYGVDNRPVSAGHDGQFGKRNSPTVFNAALQLAQFWDGRAADVEEQALGPILNPIEMGMSSGAEVLEKLKLDLSTVEEFEAAFPGEDQPITFPNVGLAIGAFERTLLAPSRFDEYLKGKSDALTEEEKSGGRLFVATGCVICHNGAAVGGGMFQKLGLAHPYPTEDKGRFEATNNFADLGIFKVPSLRNVERTGPYFHDGSVKTLEEAVRRMAYYQLDKTLSDDQVASIVTFLRSLTASKLPQ